MKINSFFILLFYSLLISCDPKPKGVSDEVYKLGEGAIWDSEKSQLLFLDILNGSFNIYTPEHNSIERFDFEENIGTVVPVKNENEWLLAFQSGVKLLGMTGDTTLLCHPEKNNTGTRYNDGKCDPFGNFWVGSMALNTNLKNKGSLYRVFDGENCDTILNSVSISNGIAWSLDTSELYYIDTPERSIYIYELDQNGSIKAKKDSIIIPEELGLPDGSTLDSEGHLWVAMWGGHCVTRWDIDNKKLLEKIDVPALNVTSLAFGGEDLKTLFITTARVGTSKKELLEYPESGKLLKLETNVKGIPCNYFIKK